MLLSYSVTGATQPFFFANHKTSSEQNTRSTFISEQVLMRELRQIVLLKLNLCDGLSEKLRKVIVNWQKEKYKRKRKQNRVRLSRTGCE